MGGRCAGGAAEDAHLGREDLLARPAGAVVVGHLHHKLVEILDHILDVLCVAMQAAARSAHRVSVFTPRRLRLGRARKEAAYALPAAGLGGLVP